MPIIVQFSTSPQLLHRAQMAVLWHIRWMRWGGIFVVVIFPLFMFSIGLARGLGWQEALTSNLAWIVGFPVFWLLGIPLMQRWGARRTFRATPAAQGDRTYTFSESEIAVEGGLSSSRLAWAAIVRFVETRDLFLLFVSNQSAHFIPKSAFASDAERQQFRTLVREKVRRAENQSLRQREATT